MTRTKFETCGLYALEYWITFAGDDGREGKTHLNGCYL
jgi:hypothetical protein